MPQQRKNNKPQENRTFKNYIRGKNYYEAEADLKSSFPSQRDRDTKSRSISSTFSHYKNLAKNFVDKNHTSGDSRVVLKEDDKSGKKRDREPSKAYEDTMAASRSSNMISEIKSTPIKPVKKNRRTVTRVSSKSPDREKSSLLSESDNLDVSPKFIAEMQAELKAAKMKNERLTIERNMAFDRAIQSDKTAEKWKQEADFWRSSYQKDKAEWVANKKGNTKEYKDCIDMMVSLSFTNAELVKQIAKDHNLNYTYERFRDLENIGKVSLPISTNSRVKLSNITESVKSNKIDAYDSNLREKREKYYKYEEFMSREDKILDLHADSE